MNLTQIITFVVGGALTLINVIYLFVVIRTPINKQATNIVETKKCEVDTKKFKESNDFRLLKLSIRYYKEAISVCSTYTNTAIMEFITNHIKVDYILNQIKYNENEVDSFVKEFVEFKKNV